MNSKYNVRPLILCAFFAALTAVCSIVSIPLPFSPVPVNLALLPVYLAGGLLGAKHGAISQLVYVLLGAVGLPVFHSFTGGLSILAGPTGGFLAGYIAAAFLVGIFSEKKLHQAEFHEKKPSFFQTNGLLAGLLFGTTACYALGTLWFMYTAGSDLPSALLLCVIPFLPGDAVKILLALLLIRKLRPVLNKLY